MRIVVRPLDHDDRGLAARRRVVRRPRAASPSGPTSANGPSPCTVERAGRRTTTPCDDRARLLGVDVDAFEVAHGGRRAAAPRRRVAPRSRRAGAPRRAVNEPTRSAPQRRRGARSRRARRRGRRRASARRCRCRTRRRRRPPGTGRVRTPRRRSGRRARGRGARSTSSPARASSWRRRPPTFTADTIGGSCSMSPRKRGSARSTSSRVDRHRPLVEHLAGGVERAGGDAEHDRARGTPCPPPGQEAQQAGGAAEPDEQHAGGVGVERARVADPALPVDLAQLGDDVVRRAAGRLVDDDEAVSHHRRTRRLSSSRDGQRRRGCSRRRVGMSSVDSNPAAKRWPPPPLSAAIEADVDVAERAQAHPDGAVGLLLHDAGDLGLGGAAHDVDEPLDLLERDVVARRACPG